MRKQIFTPVFRRFDILLYISAQFVVTFRPQLIEVVSITRLN